MESRLYNRLLFRLLALPVAALAVLALILGYGLQRVEESAKAIDRADVVILHGNRLTKLILDEETGLRGFLLTRNPVFLQPLHSADLQIEPEFDTLFTLIQRPDQLARLHRIQASHKQWELEAYHEIDAFPQDESTLEQHMLQRKQDMDDLRVQIDEFLNIFIGRRAQRSAEDILVNRNARILLLFAVALIAGLLVWETRRIFRVLTAAYNQQIKEIKQRVDESYAREQWLNTTIRSIGDAVIACDTEGTIVFMNRVAEELTGWQEQEAHGISLHRVFPIFNEDTRAAVENPVDKVRRLGTIVGLANHTFLVAKDGTEICIDDSGAPICDSSGKMIGIVLVFRDITERRMSEGALMRAEKLAAAGRLAASVAHEVNNPLEGLTNLVYIARRSDELDEIRHLLSQAESELGRIAHITRQSLGFYRETAIAAHFKPATVVHEVSDFYTARAATLGVALVVNTTTEREVLGTAGELRQVLSNLLANGLDACSRGDTIRLEANSATDPRDSTRQGVRITIADTGQGIPPEHLDSVFEPFFTTKKDTGTGLGLWVSRELVEKHGGSLRVRSRTVTPGCGTVFSIFLPLQGGPHSAAQLNGHQPQNDLAVN
ncbi:ATP-binding protein [Tunturiibacter gelidoferens]|uniref:PAS domain S-box-containing protein n=1 Tax=Tunturiibacter gelidiferens TaxID=3069689 RepID=A0ACC5NWW4_9BACT|nr:ATP-binding protein [Edaphobacter lichenicola]MBB5339083.1 PAS domain S-box-containing protein [Edaphobacter lichenicola]